MVRYADGCQDALNDVGLTKLAAPNFLRGARAGVAKALSWASGAAGRAADRISGAPQETPRDSPIILTDRSGRPLPQQRGLFETGDAPGVSARPPKPPSMLRRAWDSQKYVWPVANAVGGYNSNSDPNTPRTQRMIDAGVGAAANLAANRLPFTPRVVSAGVGMAAVPAVRRLRQDSE